ncbi:MAG: acyl-CoA thioesterase [Ignavibacteriae bacterium]|nr:acyl-CoA thioesterase [Ignavibacteriota bacterium]
MNKIVFSQQVYTYQIDYVGHMSNIVYIEWMEIGRTKLLEYIGLPLNKLEELGIAPVLVNTEITYKKPLYIYDEAKIEIWVSKLNNASAIMSFNFYNSKGELASVGTQKGLFVHRETMKPYRLKPEERDAFEKAYIEE